MDELKLWNSVEKTDPGITKKSGKSYLTAIDSYSQFKNATKTFGPYGIGWGVTDEKMSEFSAGLILYEADFYYVFDGVRGEFPISTSWELYINPKEGAPYLDTDVFKKVRTDALTKALSMLGFNADVFMGKFDGNKYTGASKPGSYDKGYASKFGTEDKPSFCNFCKRKHVLIGDMITKNDEGKYGAVACKNKPDTKPAQKKISEMNKSELIGSIVRAEEIVGGQDLREPHNIGGLLDDNNKVELTAYLIQLGKVIKNMK